MAMGRLKLTTETDGGVALISAAGELDASEVAKLEAALLEAEAEEELTRLILDITALEFMDSSGIAALAHAASRSEENGNRLEISRSTPPVERVLEISGIGPYLPRPQAVA